MSNIIEIKNVTKKFKNSVVLNSIFLSFESGKIHGIIGRNGSGKTMLFKCICGFVPITSGEIIVDGKILSKNCTVPDNIGAIIETPGFLPNYSGVMNLRFLAGINKKISIDQIREVMKRVGLDPKSKKWVSKYSMGMRQRLGIAQAIMESPDILILDEPLNGLDNEGVNDIRELLLGLKAEGKTIILASHSRDDIAILCDTVNELDKGFLLLKQLT